MKVVYGISDEIDWKKYGVQWEMSENGKYYRQKFPLTRREITRDEFDMWFHRRDFSISIMVSTSLFETETDMRQHPLYNTNIYATHREMYMVATHRGYDSDSYGDTFIPDAKQYHKRQSGLFVRYFRIGCEHPNLRHTSPRMHEQQYNCPDCGYNASYDSSG
jgi:hypothetical protein